MIFWRTTISLECLVQKSMICLAPLRQQINFGIGIWFTGSDLSGVRFVSIRSGLFLSSTKRIECQRIDLLVTKPLKHLTNRWIQLLAVVKSTFDLMKQFSMSGTLAAASGGSAPSR